MALPDHLLEQRVSTHVADDLEDRALAIQTTAEAEAEMAGKYTKSLGDVRDTLISMDVSEGTIKQVLLEAALKGKSGYEERTAAETQVQGTIDDYAKQLERNLNTMFNQLSKGDRFSYTLPVDRLGIRTDVRKSYDLSVKIGSDINDPMIQIKYVPKERFSLIELFFPQSNESEWELDRKEVSRYNDTWVGGSTVSGKKNYVSLFEVLAKSLAPKSNPIEQRIVSTVLQSFRQLPAQTSTYLLERAGQLQKQDQLLRGE